MLQSFFCIDTRLIALLFLISLSILAFFNSNRVTIEKSDIIIIFVLILFNIYFIGIAGKGGVFLTPTYMLILSIVLSKVVFPYLSLKEFPKKINFIYLFIIYSLVFEYLLLLFGFGEFIIQNLSCYHSEIQVYRSLHNLTSNVLSINVAGLNSIMMGAQTASQFSAIIFVWYFYRYKSNTIDTSVFLVILPVIILALSLTNTGILLFAFSVTILYLIHISNNFYKKIKSLNKLYYSLIVFLLAIVSLYEIISLRYDIFSQIYEDVILLHLSGFYQWSSMEILFGASNEKIINSFYTGEITFLRQLAYFGVIGVGFFYLTIIFYILRVVKNKKVMAQTELMVVPVIIIIIIFIAGNIHYQVMFQAGVRELFSMLLGYIIYKGARRSNLK
jgi:hypothetical protein